MAKDKSVKKETTVEPTVAHELITPSSTTKNSFRFLIDPNEVKAPAYASDDIRSAVEHFKNERNVRPNVVEINTTSLERLGYRDTLVELGISIVESSGYDENIMVLSVKE